MCTMSDGETFEKTIIFGGITHSKLASQSDKPTPRQHSKLKASPKALKQSSQNTTPFKYKSPERSSAGASQEKSRQALIIDSINSSSPLGVPTNTETSHLSNDLYILEIRSIV